MNVWFLALAFGLGSGGDPTAAAVKVGAALRTEVAPHSNDSFERGVDAYRRGEYDAADAFWRDCLELPLADPELASVSYNLANAAWRRGEGLVAVGWYTMSLRYAPRDADTWYNLELVRAESGLEPADRGDLRSTLNRLVSALLPHEARALAAAALALLALALIGEALRGGRFWRRSSCLAAFLFITLSLPWIRTLRMNEGDPLLVIRAPSVALRSEPRRALEPIADVEAGARVQRIDALPGWVRVETKAGKRGWLQQDAVFELIPDSIRSGG